jgi:hypothetical protein
MRNEEVGLFNAPPSIEGRTAGASCVCRPIVHVEIATARGLAQAQRTGVDARRRAGAVRKADRRAWYDAQARAAGRRIHALVLRTVRHNMGERPEHAALARWWRGSGATREEDGCSWADRLGHGRACARGNRADAAAHDSVQVGRVRDVGGGLETLAAR